MCSGPPGKDRRKTYQRRVLQVVGSRLQRDVLFTIVFELTVVLGVRQYSGVSYNSFAAGSRFICVGTKEIGDQGVTSTLIPDPVFTFPSPMHRYRRGQRVCGFLLLSAFCSDLRRIEGLPPSSITIVFSFVVDGRR